MVEEQHATDCWEVWVELADRHCRTLEEVSEDMLLPASGGLGGDDPFQSQRHLAIAHVLCSIPPGDYQRLTGLVDSFCWFIPHHQTDGHIEPFPITVKEEGGSLTLTYAKVLYLSPRLEGAAWDITVATVAHELAHIALGHSVVSVHPDIYEVQEAAAWLRVCDWGFEREAKKQEAMYKRRASLERRMIERFRQRTLGDCDTISEQRR